MPEDESGRKVAVLVLSCDRYADLWEPYFEVFYRHWPDVSYPVYLLGNERSFDHPRVKTILSGPDEGWASSLRRGVEQLNEPFVLTLLEDAFFARPLDGAMIECVADWAVATGASACRMRPEPPADLPENDLVGRVSPGVLYRTSLFATLWRRDKLLELLSDDRSPWAFELEGHIHTIGDPNYFATHSNLFPVIHGVEKGMWLRPAIRDLARLGVSVNLDARPPASRSRTVAMCFARTRGWVLNRIPARSRARVLTRVQGIYRKLRIRR